MNNQLRPAENLIGDRERAVDQKHSGLELKYILIIA